MNSEEIKLLVISKKSQVADTILNGTESWDKYNYLRGYQHALANILESINAIEKKELDRDDQL